MSIFEGAGVALVTPFHEDGSVNYEKLEQIVEEQMLAVQTVLSPAVRPARRLH